MHISFGKARLVSMLLAAVLSDALPRAHAQQLATAGIYGDVLDAQGAVIPEARVTLTYIDRNQDRNAVTNAGGEFAFPLIPIGAYRLRVEKAGFHTFEQTGIVLEVNDNRKIDVTLEVGQLSTKVTVEAAAATVETSNATLKSVIDGKRILELPLNGRNVASLTGLVAGVVSVGVNAGDSKDAAGASTFSVNGSRQNSIKFTLDGGDNQDNLQN
ncbi:MAG: carboxypeptidase-like regulatory domain-containing protein, partial [Bryobacteraceae bacterium]